MKKYVEGQRYQKKQNRKTFKFSPDQLIAIVF